MPRKAELKTREYVSHDPHTVALLQPDARKTRSILHRDEQRN